MSKTILVAAVLAGGCGGSDFECAIGELTGSWRLHYEETDGTCGAIADETALFDPAGALPGNCVTNADNLSADRCEYDLDYTCTEPTFTQRWVSHFEQIDEDFMRATATLTFTDAAGSCRSTYDVTITKL